MSTYTTLGRIIECLKSTRDDIGAILSDLRSLAELKDPRPEHARLQFHLRRLAAIESSLTAIESTLAWLRRWSLGG